MKKRLYTLPLVAFIAFIGITNQLHALPMFTKQTGFDCAVCHMQGMPKLNSFGRNFMLSGMTMSQKVADINSSSFDINPSLLIKAKYEKSWDKPSKSGWVQDKPGKTNEGRWSIPRTALAYVGGRLNENIGALVRLSYREDHDESISGKAVYAKETDNGHIGLAFYSSSNFGPFSGMEVYNTGLYKPIRSFEGRKLVNATQVCDIGTGSATGLQVYFDSNSLFGEDDHLFGTIGMYAPAQDNLYLNLTDNLLPFARVAYEFPIGDYNLILGAFTIVGGTTTNSENAALRVKRETYGIDVQLEGEVFEKSISIIATNIFKNKVNYTGYGAGSTEDLESQYNDAFSIEGQIMMNEDIGLKLSYLRFNDRYDYEKKNYINAQDINAAITAGIDYNFVVYVPMKFAVEYSWVKPGLERVKDHSYVLFTLTLPF